MAYTTRTADWVIGKAWLEAKGKANTPTSGTKYNTLLGLVDTELKNWQDEEGVEWDSLWSMVTLTGGVSITDTYALSTSIRKISKREGDYIYLLSADGTQKKPIKLVRPNQLYEHNDDQFYAAQIGRNLVFSKAFAADSSYIGYSINVPSYGYVNDITAGTDIVNCDDPLYVAYMVAASFARNDLVKSGQYQNILDKADVRMESMKQNNSGQDESYDNDGVAEGDSYS